MQATAKTCGCSYCVEGGSGPFQHFYPGSPAGMTLDRAAFLAAAGDAVKLEAAVGCLSSPDLWACTIWLWNHDESIRRGMASFGGYESRAALLEEIIRLADGHNLRWMVRNR